MTNQETKIGPGLFFFWDITNGKLLEPQVQNNKGNNVKSMNRYFHVQIASALVEGLQQHATGGNKYAMEYYIIV